MLANWTAYFAARLEALFSFYNTPVYSNIDPDRDYAGGRTVEVQENQKPEVTTFISGRCVVTRYFIIACRAPSQYEAFDMARAARSLIYDVLRIFEDDGVLSGAVIEDYGTEPDERGVVTGESFYGYVSFRFTEDGGYPD